MLLPGEVLNAPGQAKLEASDSIKRTKSQKNTKSKIKQHYHPRQDANKRRVDTGRCDIHVG